MKNLILLGIILITSTSTTSATFLTLNLEAQNEKPAETKSKTFVEELSFMLGEWEGEGWSMTRKGKSTSQIKEKAECKLECNIMVVEGLGTILNPETEETEVVHEAYAVITFDKEREVLVIRAYKDADVIESDIVFLEDKIIQWKLNLPNGSQVKYTIDFSTENKWIEHGEFSSDGESWIPILEMELTKVEEEK